MSAVNRCYWTAQWLQMPVFPKRLALPGFIAQLIQIRGTEKLSESLIAPVYVHSSSDGMHSGVAIFYPQSGIFPDQFIFICEGEKKFCKLTQKQESIKFGNIIKLKDVTGENFPVEVLQNQGIFTKIWIMLGKESSVIMKDLAAIPALAAELLKFKTDFESQLKEVEEGLVMISECEKIIARNQEILSSLN